VTSSFKTRGSGKLKFWMIEVFWGAYNLNKLPRNSKGFLDKEAELLI
jgi:hypothetical protein